MNNNYFVSIFFFAGVPGGYNEYIDSRHLIPHVENVVWCHDKDPVRCKGLIVHHVSIFTSSDLHLAGYRVNLDNIQGPFFHNKYFMEVDHTVMECMEEQLIIRNKKEYENDCMEDYYLT